MDDCITFLCCTSQEDELDFIIQKIHLSPSPEITQHTFPLCWEKGGKLCYMGTRIFDGCFGQWLSHLNESPIF